MIFLTLSLKSLIFLRKINDFLKIVVQIFDIPLKNIHFIKIVVQIFDFPFKNK